MYTHESSINVELAKLTALLQEARKIIKCHCKNTNPDWLQRADDALKKNDKIYARN
jgi:hypothetical protein